LCAGFIKSINDDEIVDEKPHVAKTDFDQVKSSFQEIGAFSSEEDEECVVALKQCSVQVKRLTLQEIEKIRFDLTEKRNDQKRHKSPDIDDRDDTSERTIDTVELNTFRNSRSLRKRRHSKQDAVTELEQQIKVKNYLVDESELLNDASEAIYMDQSEVLDIKESTPNSPENNFDDHINDLADEIEEAVVEDPEEIVKKMDPNASPEERSKIYYSALCICNICHQVSNNIFKTTDCLSKHQHRKCWVCMKVLHTDSSVKTHYQVEHGIPKTTGVLMCPICDTAQKIDNFVRHMNIEHLDKVSNSTEAKGVVKPFIRRKQQDTTPIILSSKSLKVGKQKGSRTRSRRKQQRSESEADHYSESEEQESSDFEVSEDEIPARKTRGRGRPIGSRAVREEMEIELPRKNLRQRKEVTYDESGALEVDPNAFVEDKSLNINDNCGKNTGIGEYSVVLAEGTEIPISELPVPLDTEIADDSPLVSDARSDRPVRNKGRGISSRSRIGPKSKVTPVAVSHVELTNNPFLDDNDPVAVETEPTESLVEQANQDSAMDVSEFNVQVEDKTAKGDVNPMAIAMKIRNAMRKAKEKAQDPPPTPEPTPQPNQASLSSNFFLQAQAMVGSPAKEISPQEDSTSQVNPSSNKLQVVVPSQSQFRSDTNYAPPLNVGNPSPQPQFMANPDSIQSGPLQSQYWGPPSMASANSLALSRTEGMGTSQPMMTSPTTINGRVFCGTTMVNGVLFNIYKRMNNTSPHPNTIISFQSNATTTSWSSNMGLPNGGNSNSISSGSGRNYGPMYNYGNNSASSGYPPILPKSGVPSYNNMGMGVQSMGPSAPYDNQDVKPFRADRRGTGGNSSWIQPTEADQLMRGGMLTCGIPPSSNASEEPLNVTKCEKCGQLFFISRSDMFDNHICSVPNVQ